VNNSTTFQKKKKNLNLQGVRPPPSIAVIEEDLLIQTEKTPKPLRHSKTGAPLPCENRARPFDLCFGYRTDEGIFLTTLKFTPTESQTHDLWSAAKELPDGLEAHWHYFQNTNIYIYAHCSIPLRRTTTTGA
jgi:hypothetical protein